MTDKPDEKKVESGGEVVKNVPAASTNVAKRIKGVLRIEELPSSRHLKVLVCGESGTGKTMFAGTAIDIGSVFVADFDEGVETLKNIPRFEKVEHKTYKPVMKRGVVVGGGWQEFKSDWEKLKTSDYDTLVVDSISTLEQTMGDWYLASGKHPRLTLQNYGDIIMWFQRWFQSLKAIDKHIIVTSHEQLVKDEVVGDISYKPSIVGKRLGGKLPLWFDEVYRSVCRASGEGTEYKLLTRAGPRHTAKSRIGILPDVINPDFGEIIKLWQAPNKQE